MQKPQRRSFYIVPDQRCGRSRSRTHSGRRTLDRARKNCPAGRRPENSDADVGDGDDSAGFRTSDDAPVCIGTRIRKGHFSESFRPPEAVHRPLQRVQLHGQQAKLHEDQGTRPGTWANLF